MFCPTAMNCAVVTCVIITRQRSCLSAASVVNASLPACCSYQESSVERAGQVLRRQ